MSVRVASLQVRDVDSNQHHLYPNGVLQPDQGVWFRPVRVGGHWSVERCLQCR